MTQSAEMSDEGEKAYHCSRILGTSDEAVLLLSIGDLAELLHSASPIYRQRRGADARTTQSALKALFSFRERRLEPGIQAVIRLFFEMFRDTNWVHSSVKVQLNEVRQDRSLSKNTRELAQSVVETLGWPLT